MFLSDHLFAHRGLHNESKGIYKNSKSAILEAINHGYGIECDIRVSKDGVPYLFHDHNLFQETGYNALFEDTISTIIDQLVLHDSTERLMKLEDFIHLLMDTPVLLEIKPAKNQKRAVKIIYVLLQKATFPYAIHSFSPKVIWYYKKLDSRILRGQIVRDLNKWCLRTSLKITSIFTKPDFYNHNIQFLPNKYTDKLYQKGISVLSYSATSEQELSFIRDRYTNAVFEDFLPKKG